MKFLKMKIKTILIILLICFINKSLNAQERKDTIEVGNVTINQTRKLSQVALNNYFIDSLLLLENIENNLSDLLSKNSTIFIKNYGKGSLSTASFRGTAATHTQVVWNGMKLNSPMIGQVDFSNIPIFFVDEIKLFYGGSSLSESSGALGGSIIINNKPDWNNKISLSAIQKIASFNTYSSFANINIGNKKKQLKTKIFIEQSENNFKYINNTNPEKNIEKQTNANYNKYGVMQEAYFRITKNSFVSFIIWAQKTNRNIPPIMSYSGLHRNQFQIDKQLKNIISYNINISKIKLKFNSGYNYDGINYFLSDSTYNTYIIKSNSKSNSNSIVNNIELKYLFNNKNELKFDFFYNHSFVNIYDTATYSFTKYNANRNELGGKFSYHKKINKRFAGYILFYQNIVDKNIIPFIPAIGLESKFMKNNPLYIKTNISRNYHVPTLNDLYWIPGGNADLLPEVGYSFDINFNFIKNFKNSKMTNSLSVYSSLIDNWIVWRPSESIYWTAQNIKKVFSRGLEYSFDLKGVYKKIEYQFITNYAFTKTTNQKSDLQEDKSISKQLIYIPKNTFGIFATLLYQKFYIRTNINYIGKRYTTSSNYENRHTLPAYSICNISVGKDYLFKNKKINLTFKVNNLLNKQYQAILYRAMPGRNYSLMLKFSL